MRIRRLARLLTLAACLAGLSACGSTSSEANSSGSSGSDSAGYSAFLSFSECMRAHGVTNFPDPSPGGGIQLNAASGVNPFSPAFKAAQAKCNKLLPGGGPGAGGQPSASAERGMLATSRCMRAHGVSGFPDPTTTPPSSPEGDSIVLGGGHVFLVVPATIDTASPAFERAASACGFGPRRAKIAP